jgi:hypothetical protein
VKKTDGTVPTVGAMSEAVKNFKREKEQRGRRTGYVHTSKKEDAQILKTFKKMRPPGSFLKKLQKTFSTPRSNKHIWKCETHAQTHPHTLHPDTRRG